MKKISVFMLCFMMVLAVGCSKDLKVTVKDNLEVEYGDQLDHSLLFDKEQSDEDITVKEVKNFDSKKTGEQEVIVVFSNADEKTKEETIKVAVKDTKKPVIKLKKEKVEITVGDKFDAASNIESVKDPVDGDIKKSDDKKLTKNGYIIASDVNAKKAGSYTVKITAYDVNGNKAESSYKVTVKKKPQEQASTQTNSSSNGNSGYTSSQGSYSKPTSGSTGSNSKPAQSKPQTPSTSTSKPSGPCNHRGEKMVEGMWFDTDEECEAWARQYQEHQWYDLGNTDFGCAWGVYTCPDCGKIGIHRFY